ncbi:hypothetical protein MKY19_07750 [Paenibacillus sp. FSL R5-0744]|uniref:hypothetical protein n=1 Tax=unclassified Paenibacillus TaxID=185978 RepID=UPI0030D7DAF9
MLQSPDVEPWEEEPEVWIDYVCVECGTVDPVPEFIVGECAYDLESGESPEFVSVTEPW